MKVAVGEGAIPADHDAVADADFGFAHEDDAGEIAVVADGDSAGFADGELAVVEGAVAANEESDFQLAVEAAEGGGACEDAALADFDIRGGLVRLVHRTAFYLYHQSGGQECPPSCMRTKGKIIVSGIAFWYPLAGVTWQFLHYLLGLQRLGHDVYYVEDSYRRVYDPMTNDFITRPTANIRAIAPILEAHGFKNKWCFRSHYPPERCFGLSESQLTQLYQDADVFLNVTGAQEIRDEHMNIPRRIYVETDP